MTPPYSGYDETDDKGTSIKIRIEIERKQVPEHPPE